MCRATSGCTPLHILSTQCEGGKQPSSLPLHSGMSEATAGAGSGGPSNAASAMSSADLGGGASDEPQAARIRSDEMKPKSRMSLREPSGRSEVNSGSVTSADQNAGF